MNNNGNPSKLFVGNLSFKTTRQELMDYFQTVGRVIDAVILTNKFSGRSRGFGFVEMSTPEEALAAKEKLNGVDFMGRALIVGDAKPETPRQEEHSDVEPVVTTDTDTQTQTVVTEQPVTESDTPSVPAVEEQTEPAVATESEVTVAPTQGEETVVQVPEDTTQVSES